MNKPQPRLGAKVRGLRRQRKLTQVELARRLEISASYLNLIEHDQRALTAPLLLRIAQEFDLDLRDFTGDADEQLHADLIEVFTDRMFDGQTVGGDELKELVGSSPAVARSVLTLYRALREARQSVDSLAAEIYDGQQVPGVDHSPMPQEEVSDFVQRHSNYFPELEDAASRLWERGALQRTAMTTTLSRYLRDVHEIEVKPMEMGTQDVALRRYDRSNKRLLLSEHLSPSSRRFQLAVQIALIDHDELLSRLAVGPELTTDESRALCRVVLANYFAGAVTMPYDDMLAAAKSERYDIVLLSHRFGATFEQVCHRLTALRRPDAEGVPFHMIRVDVAGNISKRFSASGIRFARFAGACPRWNVFSAFGTPGAISVQTSIMPDGQAFFCLARALAKGHGGYLTPHTIMSVGLGCDIKYARELVYSDGVDLDHLEGAVKVGVTCRLCERRDCEQRAFPSIHRPLVIDEQVRGPSFFMPPVDESDDR